MKRELMLVWITVFGFLAQPGSVGWSAGLELHGNPDELAPYLAGLPQITEIAGYARKEFQADQAVVVLSAITEAKSLEEALRQNLELRRDLIKTLTKKGVGQERIHSSKFSSVPELGKFSGKVRQYKVENQVRITVDNEEEFQAVAEQIDQEEKLHFQRLETEDLKKSDREMSVLGEALDQVLAKKGMLEEKFGVTLVPKRIAQPRLAESKIGVQGGTASGFESVRQLPGRESLDMAIHALDQFADAGAGFGQIRYAARVEVHFETVWKLK